ncbi:EamA family transporter [Nocardioides sp.]|uniref:EamA family transporter n=1 Tax=Nocardioides sp. TaxID=35761 RepID=UPI0039E4CEC0
MAVLLALLSAIAYGTSDFIGGLVSARISPWASAFASQCGGTAAILVLALADPVWPAVADLGWGALSGAGTGLGMVFLYRGLSCGRMGVVAPVSGLTSALLPAIVGVATGERPSAVAWLGVLLALPSTYLVARTPPAAEAGPGAGSRDGVLDGFLAGCGFGGGFAAIAQADTDSGHLPLGLGLGVGAVLVALAAVLVRQDWLPRQRVALVSAGGGVLGGVALIFFVLATHHGMLTVSGVISSLYPAATVVLAVVVLREHIHRGQAVGLGLCAVAVALVAGG